MLATSHFLAGAALGKTLRRPWLAFPAAFASHFLLDFTPHLDSHALLGAGHGTVTLPELCMAAADTVTGMLLVAWATRGHAERRLLVLGAFFAMLMDIVDNVPPWGDWFSAWPVTAGLSAFHHDFQHNLTPTQWLLGFGTQAVVILVALWILRRVPASQARGRAPLVAGE